MIRFGYHFHTGVHHGRISTSDSIVQARSGLQTYGASVWLDDGRTVTDRVYRVWYAANTPAVMMFVFSVRSPSLAWPFARLR